MARENDLIQKSFVGIRDLPKGLNIITYCTECIMFELSSCPYPDSNMTTSYCVHFKPKDLYLRGCL